MVMADALLRTHAERQGEVRVRLLPIMIRTDGVHPQNNFIMIIILKQVATLHKYSETSSQTEG